MMVLVPHDHAHLKSRPPALQIKQPAQVSPSTHPTGAQHGNMDLLEKATVSISLPFPASPHPCNLHEIDIHSKESAQAELHKHHSDDRTAHPYQ
eukprot:6488686-Amphidinium_carterae.3